MEISRTQYRNEDFAIVLGMYVWSTNEFDKVHPSVYLWNQFLGSKTEVWCTEMTTYSSIYIKSLLYLLLMLVYQVVSVQFHISVIHCIPRVSILSYQLARSGFEPGTIRSRSRRLNHSTTAPTILLIVKSSLWPKKKKQKKMKNWMK